MKMVYTHPNSMMVGSMEGLLAQADIKTEIRNDLLGGAAGELAPGETWVELWVVNDFQADYAKQLIESALAEVDADDWQCSHCHETNPATFETCWQCGAERSEPPA